MSTKIKKGSIVKVINWGQLYSTYKEMANRLRLKHWGTGNENPYGQNDVFKVVNIVENLYVGIENEAGRQYVIGIGGLQITNEKMKKNNKKKKVTPTYFVEIDEDGETTGSCYTTIEDVKENLCGGDFVAEVKMVKKYKLVDESVKLVEVK